MATELESTFYRAGYRETIRRLLEAAVLTAVECLTEDEIQQTVDSALGKDE